MMAAVDAVRATASRPSGEDLAASALTLARAFAAGATMWCVAPQWPSHGRHVAVEFVHPVIVGKRALPAVFADTTTDVESALRLLARPGDVLLVISTAGDAASADLLRRAEAWGLIRVWLGTGARPPAPSAEHLVWLDTDDAEQAARSGDLVLCYHLLWELTHVVFEHPGLLEPSPPCRDEVCITCADEGRVAEVQRVRDEHCADVLVGGHSETVDLGLVDEVRPRDLLLVHAGVALTTLDP